MYSSGPGSKHAAAWYDSVYNLIDLCYASDWVYMALLTIYGTVA